MTDRQRIALFIFILGALVLGIALTIGQELSDRSLRIAWLASNDNVAVAGYELLREGAVIGRSTEPASEVKGLAPGREYCLEVRAFDAAGLRSPSSSQACARTPDLTPPTVPGRPADGSRALRRVRQVETVIDARHERLAGAGEWPAFTITAQPQIFVGLYFAGSIRVVQLDEI